VCTCERAFVTSRILEVGLLFMCVSVYKYFVRSFQQY